MLLLVYFVPLGPYPYQFRLLDPSPFLSIYVSLFSAHFPCTYLYSSVVRYFLLRYESQSLEIEYYFPSVLTKVQLSEYTSRKQSLYFEPSESFEAQKQGTQEEHGSTEERFRVRSGTDISNALISHRYKFRRSRSQMESKASLDEEFPPLNPSIEPIAELAGELKQELKLGHPEDDILNTEDDIINPASGACLRRLKIFTKKERR